MFQSRDWVDVGSDRAMSATTSASWKFQSRDWVDVGSDNVGQRYRIVSSRGFNPATGLMLVRTAHKRIDQQKESVFQSRDWVDVGSDLTFIKDN